MRDYLVRIDAYARTSPQSPRPRYFLIEADSADSARKVGDRICARRFTPGPDWNGAVVQAVTSHVERWED